MTLVVSLIFMKQGLSVGGLRAIPADFLFIFTAAAWLGSVALGQAKMRWHPTFWALPVYFLALAASLVVSDAPNVSFLKLASELYLISLPILAFNLVRDEQDLRQTFVAWIIPSALLATLAVTVIVLFPVLGPDSILDGPLHHFGTLPPGPYPRLELTFTHPAMMANFLTVSLMILMVSTRLRWISASLAWPLGIGLAIAAFFALTPGLSGFTLAAGLGIASRWREIGRLVAAKIATFAGLAGAVAFTLSAVATPISRDGAPVLIDTGGLLQLFPSVRLLTWSDSAANFMRSPWLGSGIGTDAVAVQFVIPSGETAHLTDAHNMFLNIAAQCGIIGLAGLLVLITAIWRVGGPFKAPVGQMGVARWGLAIALLCALVVEGLVGSFEDARHLWIAFGLLAAAAELEDCSTSKT